MNFLVSLKKVFQFTVKVVQYFMDLSKFIIKNQYLISSFCIYLSSIFFPASTTLSNLITFSTFSSLFLFHFISFQRSKNKLQTPALAKTQNGNPIYMYRIFYVIVLFLNSQVLCHSQAVHLKAFIDKLNSLFSS